MRQNDNGDGSRGKIVKDLLRQNGFCNSLEARQKTSERSGRE